MNFPIQARPVQRSRALGSTSPAAGGIQPSACFYSGSAPSCEGEPGDCVARGFKFCGYSDCGDGACCTTGRKVLCCADECP